MGYHSKENVQKNYEISIQKACEVCDSHTIIDDEDCALKGDNQQLQDQIRSLEKQRNVQSANYNLCDTDKKALSILFVNYKANSQLELNKLQSRYETLNSTMLGFRNLFNDVNKKAQDCENDKNGFTNKILRLEDQLRQSDANSAECLNSLESKSSDNTKLLAEKNKLENENQTRERLLQDKNTECEKAQQKLSEDNRGIQIKLNDLQGKYEKINGEKIQLQTEYDQVLNNNNGLKEDLKGCRENLGKGCKDVEDKLKPEITRLEANLNKINDDLGKCTSNLAIVTTEKATINAELSSKTSNLESCQKDLSKTENERDGFKTKFEQVTVQYDTLTQKDKEQEGQISDLKKLNVNLGLTNSQLTIDSNSCSENLKSSQKLLDEKNIKITEFDLKILGFTAKENTLKASLLAAQKSKMNGYKESCDLMHQRYKKYYDGASSNKSIFDRIVDKFTEWFTSRYSDTRPIWNESSLKGLLCTWQKEGVVQKNAIIKTKYKDGSTKNYKLDDMCTDKTLIENFSREIIDPCNDEGGIWSYDL